MAITRTQELILKKECLKKNEPWLKGKGIGTIDDTRNAMRKESKKRNAERVARIKAMAAGPNGIKPNKTK